MWELVISGKSEVRRMRKADGQIRLMVRGRYERNEMAGSYRASNSANNGSR